MSEIVEGMGAAIEGALSAKAVEPHGGAASVDAHDETACANCGAALTGPYCQQCGQKAHVHRTLSAIGHDLMHGVLHLDGKLAHTLPLLAFKPGRLTRRYIEGERAKFVSPMAMFLFSVFAMFAVFQMIGLSAPTSFDLEEAIPSLETQIRADITALEDQLAAMPQDDPERAGLEEDLADLREVLEGVRYEIAEGASISIKPTGLDWFDKGVVKKWRDNPGLMLYKLQANGYKFSWLLIPLSLPFMWLLFAWKRGVMAYDHAVFVTYSLSFMSLLFIALSLANVAGLSAGWVFALFATIAPLHLYKHLKHTYALSRFSTLWRFLVLMVSILAILLLFLQALVVLGAF